MSLLFTITYAAFAKGTHHKLALDALQHLKCQDWEQWQRLFLKHAKLFVEGSKAPDDQFKDFTNHVLHTRDGLWGGAPEKAREWYQHTVEALVIKDWPTAVYCAGVLSHYYTDPLMPFHTAQSEAENNIHRATEWSINKSYDDLRVLGEKEWTLGEPVLPTGENWLAELVVANARMSNANYEKLIAHYDITRGVSDPPAGLDTVARRMVAELIRFASLTFAGVLGRALDESGVKPPEVALTGPMLLAAAGIPANMLAKRIADAKERDLVRAMYDELQATGTVEKTLPVDDRVVREAHAREVLAKQPPAPAASKVFPFKPRDPASAPVVVPRARKDKGSNVVALRAPEPKTMVPAAAAAETQAPAAKAERAPTRPPAPAPMISLVPDASRIPQAAEPAPASQPAAEPAPHSVVAQIDSRSRDPRYFLTPDHDVVEAPAIGPKTAQRLKAQGIATVRDLLKADAKGLAAALDSRHITAETVLAWQHQATLVCKVPGLRGTHAQLLVGAGYTTADALASADAEKVCADVLAYAQSEDGQRLLRNGEPPDLEKIKAWLTAARSTAAA